MTVYATWSDVAAVTGATYSVPEQTQLTTLLTDASAFLQDEVIGCQVVAPTATVTVTIEVPAGQQWIRLPSTPVQSVTTVAVGGGAVSDWEYQADRGIYRAPGWWDDVILGSQGASRDVARVTVTYVHGFATAPSDLKRWTIVLALQAKKRLEQLGTFGPGSTTSVAIDDYRETFQVDPAAALGFEMPAAARESMRARYGGGAAVVAA